MDDEIEAIGSTLSLTCPLGQCRITTPIRSELCNHSQCFDAQVFFEMNKMIPTWECPICYKSIENWELLFIDGYFQDILEKIPQHLHQVHVEPNGDWGLESPKSGNIADKNSILGNNLAPDTSIISNVLGILLTGDLDIINPYSDLLDSELKGSDCKSIKRRSSSKFEENGVKKRLIFSKPNEPNSNFTRNDSPQQIVDLTFDSE
ncbi:E3 SUMO-protein ligase pli1 [Smittium culicis]|uniref:E3 SUMO-protein ligase pli1 n=1 Tax=Smittium culicis TaxID=133412 RepID=A0A1R1YLR6_9FUNG|nr:E3 SUMO-protein ligase pli1 [Smittium culicis]